MVYYDNCMSYNYFEIVIIIYPKDNVFNLVRERKISELRVDKIVIFL